MQGSYSERPKVLEHGSWTKATPFKERKHYRRVSDAIANNYSPAASHLNTAVIYETTKFGENPQRVKMLLVKMFSGNKWGLISINFLVCEEVLEVVCLVV